VPLPPGLPTAFQAVVADALLDVVRRYGRTHGSFTTGEVAQRFGIAKESAEAVLNRLVGLGRVVEGGFRPGGTHREWCDHEVLRTIRRKSLARLRKEVEPVEQATLARLFTRWQGVTQPRRGLDALLDVVENLQGAPVPASMLETEVLPARILGYKPADLDTLIAAGEVVWCGLEAIGEKDGRVALYLAEKLPLLWAGQGSGLRFQGSEVTPTSERETAVVEYLRGHGASFFQELHDGTGGGYPGETIDAIWNLVWRGLLRNDALQALRAYCDRSGSSGSGRNAKPARRVHQQTGFRSRRTTPPTAQGRWALNAVAFDEARSGTEWSHAIALQLLARYGVVFRETAHAEGLPGGFSAVYDVLKAMEESGKVRRGYFAADLGATQFAMPAAVDLLRSLRVKRDGDKSEMLMLAATDPANPYGTLLKWPAGGDAGSSLTRSVGARVVLCDGSLIAYLRRGNPNIQVFLPEEEPARGQAAKALAEFLVERAQMEGGMLLTGVNGTPVHEHWTAKVWLEAGFVAAPMGFNVRRALPALPGQVVEARG
jgi:ATP-dependent Lhr-like helicase